MNDFDIPVDLTHNIEDLLITLNAVNYRLADLKNIKENLEQRIIELSGRATFTKNEENGKVEVTDLVHEGQRTHTFGKYKVRIKTDYLRKIKIEEYLAKKNHLRKEFNPIVEETSYKVNSKVLKDIEKYGSAEDNLLVSEFIYKVPAKPSVIIEANV